MKPLSAIAFASFVLAAQIKMGGNLRIGGNFKSSATVSGSAPTGRQADYKMNNNGTSNSWTDSSGNGNTATLVSDTWGSWVAAGYQYPATGGGSLEPPTTITGSIRSTVFVMTTPETPAADRRTMIGGVSTPGESTRESVYWHDQTPIISPSTDPNFIPRTRCLEPLPTSGSTMITFVLADPADSKDHIYINKHECRGYERQNSTFGTYTWRGTDYAGNTQFRVTGGRVEIGGASAAQKWNAPATLHRVQLYSTVLTAANIVYLFNNLKTDAATDHGVTLTDASTITTDTAPFIVFLGNSITRPTQTGTGYMAKTSGWPYLAVSSLTTRVNWINLGIDGRATKQMLLTAPGASDPCAIADLKAAFTGSAASLKILVIQEGTNDLNSGNGLTVGANCGWTSGTALTASAAYSDLTTLATLAKAAVPGLKVVFCTILPSVNPGATFETNRLAVNASARADSTTWDAIADMASDSIMGDLANGTNTTYYQDGTHPTTTGNAILAPYAKAAFVALGLS